MLRPSFATCLVQQVLFLVLVSQLCQALSVHRRATTCNGHPELCDRGYGNVTFVGAHDSYAVGTDNLSTNQDYNITQQLNDGIRMLQMQAHNDSGVIQLCHTSCALYNGGTLADYLATVNTWLQANPNEVLSMLIVNSDGFQPTDFDAVFQSSGVAALSFAPPTAAMAVSDWPSLGSLIDAGKRVITFLDTGANFQSVPYLVDEFTNVWETAFDVTDTTFDCNVNRTNGDPSTEMFLINHFLDQVVLGEPAPDRAQANVTNGVSGVGSLGQQVQSCVAQYGRNPNFMLVDFYEFGGGSVFEVAAAANGVTYAPTTPIATPLPDTSSTGVDGGELTSSASRQSSRSLLVAALTIMVGLYVGASGVF